MGLDVVKPPAGRALQAPGSRARARWLTRRVSCGRRVGAGGHACCLLRVCSCSSVAGRPASSGPVGVSGPHPCWTRGAAGSPGNMPMSTLPAVLGATRPLSVSWGGWTWRGQVLAVETAAVTPGARMLTVSGRCSHSVSGGARHLWGTPGSEGSGTPAVYPWGQDGPASPPLRCSGSELVLLLSLLA